jgi:hypothetical protein
MARSCRRALAASWLIAKHMARNTEAGNSTGCHPTKRQQRQQILIRDGSDNSYMQLGLDRSSNQINTSSVWYRFGTVRVYISHIIYLLVEHYYGSISVRSRLNLRPMIYPVLSDCRELQVAA